MLDKLVVLGRVFGSTVTPSVKTELTVLLEPHMIHDQCEIASATEELRSRMRLLRRLAGELPDAAQKRSENGP